jgi:hypothetical protein
LILREILVLIACLLATTASAQAFFVDGGFWDIANSNIAGLDNTKTQPTREEWGTVLILRVPL